MTKRELIREGEKRLLSCDVPDASLSARSLFLTLAGWDTETWLLRADEESTKEEQEAYFALINKRSERIPLQYLAGNTWFYGYNFLVNENVLIPRFDTEVLVQTVLEKEGDRALEVLDLCTGSGCIGITLKLCASAYTVTASDLSEKALEMAEANAKRLGAEIRFVESDLFARIPERFDLIVSNPPYIAEEEIQKLDPEVKDHEPLSALFGGADGLDFYRRIAEEAGAHLNQSGRIYLEIGYDQGASVMELFEIKGFTGGRLIRDLSGKDRVFTAVLGGYNV